MTLRVLIVDDEPLARQRLQRILRSEDGLSLLAPCADGRAAVTAILEQRPDLLFLDVQMPGMNGFEVLEAVGARQMPAVIFVTAHDRFALQAFDAEALDYLLKPFGAERVHKALARARNFLAGGARRELEQQYTSLLRATAAAREKPCILVKKRERVIVLRPEERSTSSKPGAITYGCAWGRTRTCCAARWARWNASSPRRDSCASTARGS
jgi:two-component system, LytTR family, response regulator